MALTTEATIKLVANLTGTADLLTPTSPLEVTERFRWATGTGADQSDMMWTDRRTLAASATEDIDLAGSVTGHFGNTLTFARVKLLYVHASSANTNNVNVTRVATTGIPLFLADGDGLSVRPGGTFLVVAPDVTGYLVTATTDDTISFTNSAGSTSVTYDVVIIGASA